jgi:hypothetical protein
MAKPFKNKDELDSLDVDRLKALVEGMTAADAARFGDTDPADFEDHQDIDRCFADRTRDGLVVYPEQVRNYDEYGFRTIVCAYLTLSHAAFAGGAVWDNAVGTPVFRLTDLRVRDEPGFKAWLARQTG